MCRRDRRNGDRIDIATYTDFAGLKDATLAAIGRARQAGFKNGDIAKVISTTIYQQGVNFPGLSVMINAGGGGSAIAAGQIPGRASRNVAGKDCSYIIDFWHEWDMVVGSNGRRRPGAIHSADCERKEVYESPELGFEQIWVNSIDEIPFLRRNDEQDKVEEPCEAVQEEPAQ